MVIFLVSPTCVLHSIKKQGCTKQVFVCFLQTNHFPIVYHTKCLVTYTFQHTTSDACPETNSANKGTESTGVDKNSTKGKGRTLALLDVFGL